jgi:hypothetical protein
MMRPQQIAVLSEEFNAFLFASIGEDRNGMRVSVLSGLARSGVDPWHEAAKLADLSGESAAARLAAIIGALPVRAASHSDPFAIAADLVGLLPKPSDSGSGARRSSREMWKAMNSRPWWVYVAFMCFVLGSQFLIASHQLSIKTVNRELVSADTRSQLTSPALFGP